MRVRPSALIIQDNKILTLKYTYPNGTMYTLPGGNLEMGEELKVALQRELEEELNIRTQIGDIMYIAEVLFENVNTIHFVFDVTELEGTPVINPNETKAEEIVWLDLEELDQFTLYPNIGKPIQTFDTQIFLGVVEQPRL